MLWDLVLRLAEATDSSDKENAYKKLERIGIDRDTADKIVANLIQDVEGAGR